LEQQNLYATNLADYKSKPPVQYDAQSRLMTNKGNSCATA
jgi:hypothetical protein